MPFEMLSFKLFSRQTLVKSLLLNFLEAPLGTLRFGRMVVCSIKERSPVRPLVDAALAAFRASSVIGIFLLFAITVLKQDQVEDMLQDLQLGSDHIWIPIPWVKLGVAQVTRGHIYTLLGYLALFGNILRYSTIIILAANNYDPITLDPYKDDALRVTQGLVKRLPYFYQSLFYLLAISDYITRKDIQWAAHPFYSLANLGILFAVGTLAHYGVSLALRWVYRQLRGPIYRRLFRSWVHKLFPNHTEETPFRVFCKNNPGRVSLSNRTIPLDFSFALYVLVGFCFLLWTFGGALGGSSDVMILLRDHLTSVPTLLLGLSVWLVLICFADLLDNSTSLPLKPVLFGLVLVFSNCDRDHPATGLTLATQAPERPKVAAHFRSWMDHHHPGWDSASHTTSVVFINIEGGASRSGYWAARVLNRLDAMLDSAGQKGLAETAFSYSCVSGGNLGLHVYLALQELKWQERESAIEHYFVGKEAIYPVIYKLCFGEPVGWFWPGYFRCYDRAVAFEDNLAKQMELTLENKTTFSAKRRADLSFFNSYFSRYNLVGHPERPVLMANASEVESGRRAVLSNARVNRNRYAATAFDILDELPGYRPTIAGAIHYSARFPIISPSAGISRDSTDAPSSHLVDGGYVENGGNLSTEELLLALHDDPQLRCRIRPMIIDILVSSENQLSDTASQKEVIKPNTLRTFKNSPATFLNEVSDVAIGIYGVRTGHTNLAMDRLQLLARSMGGHLAMIDFSSEKLPLNWYVSAASAGAVNARLAESFKKGLITSKDTAVKPGLSLKNGQLRAIMEHLGYDTLRIQHNDKRSDGCRVQDVVVKVTKTVIQRPRSTY